ncbi:MAG: hypothetical protein ICV83_01475, partial [Cytophagales bacterium]|nr:hypothetical protein [Cytophagales bacterium]
LSRFAGRQQLHHKLNQVYGSAFPYEPPVEFLNGEILAEVNRVRDDSNIGERFSLKADTDVQVFGVGEFLYDYVEEPWKEDNITLYFPQGNAPGGESRVNQFTFMRAIKTLAGSHAADKGIDFRQASPSPGQYRVEVKFPWRTLGYAAPGPDAAIGFEACLVDKARAGLVVKAWNARQGDIAREAPLAGLGTLRLSRDAASGHTDSVVRVQYAARAPEIDGREEEAWKNAKAYRLDRLVSGPAADGKQSAASFKTVWDQDNLYFLITVQDHSEVPAKPLFLDGDYGWIEEAGTKKVVWQMQAKDTRNAGGAVKNRYVSTRLHLKAGEYLLRYVTDNGSAYESWNDRPPETSVYGVLVRKDQSLHLF